MREQSSIQSAGSRQASWWSGWWGPSGLAVMAVAALVAAGAVNIAARTSYREVEDGVLWVARPEGVMAAEVAAGTPASVVGVRPGDLLVQIGSRPIEKPADVIDVLHRGRSGTRLDYTLLRLNERRFVTLELVPVPKGDTAFYYVLALVGLFSLLVGAAVRVRRPTDQATLHFFWLSVAFFGVFAFSFTGRFDPLDWLFYWADALALALLPPLFLHFALVFPERPRAWTRPTRYRLWPLLYLPALALVSTRILAIARASLDPGYFVGMIGFVDRVEPLYLAVYFIGALAVLVRALGWMDSLTARRQLRWIVWGTALGAGPFALGYAVPYALGWEPSLPMQLTAVPLGLVPLAFASAIVRYRLMDVEVIIKRGLVYAAMAVGIVMIYLVLLQVVTAVFSDADQHSAVIAILATLVVVLLARPVKHALQNTIDRAFYRDRYDYRRALVGFARDLNSDLDLVRLSDRLVTRVMETLLVDRMALMLAPEPGEDFASIRACGFSREALYLTRSSGIGSRVGAGHSVALDDPLAAARFAAEEIDDWRDQGVFYFIPCASNEGVIAALVLGRKDSGEPLNSEDVALLSAVAGQIATTLENGRLYRQLHLKADELERLREFNENILESLDDGLVVVDLADRVVRWNRALERLYGVPRAEAVGRPLGELFAAAFVEALDAVRHESPAGSTLFRVPLATGSRRLLVNAAAVPLRTPQGDGFAVEGTIIIIEDITARVQLEEQLQISDKMASIGLLAAGVAHEVNTPLTGISSFTQMLLEGADLDDPKTRLLEKIERQTFRAAKIVNSLLNLSRQAGPGMPERGPVDLNAVINDVLSLLEHQLEIGNIKIRRELASPGPIVVGVEYKLQQVFLNLFLNARDAMPRGGWLSIASHGSGPRALVEIADTGAGIPSEHLARIYDPFFTTKPMGQGTGLGLSIAYGIVREHDGSIACSSTVGQGTRFTLSLPSARIVGQRSTGA